MKSNLFWMSTPMVMHSSIHLTVEENKIWKLEDQDSCNYSKKFQKKLHSQLELWKVPQKIPWDKPLEVIKMIGL